MARFSVPIIDRPSIFRFFDIAKNQLKRFMVIK